ncbi:MAG: TetR/AcrR family transcriptional regulator [Solirubrobacteraceae bacterium]
MRQTEALTKSEGASGDGEGAELASVAAGGGRRYGDKTMSERRAERRLRLLDAALDAFGSNGYRATSIEQLCTAAGISTRNFYEEFPDREQLLLALHDDLNLRALNAVLQALAEIHPDDLPARAHAGAKAYFDVMTSDRRWARIALVESVGVSPTAEAHRRAAIERFAELLRAEATHLAESGAIPQRDYTLTSIALVGAINGLINTWTAEGDWGKRVDQVVEEAARLILLALPGNWSA